MDPRIEGCSLEDHQARCDDVARMRLDKGGTSTMMAKVLQGMQMEDPGLRMLSPWNPQGCNFKLTLQQEAMWWFV